VSPSVRRSSSVCSPAAGQAVLEAAGGHVTDLHGQPLRYGKPGYENPEFVARGLF
jgi:3'(2'), 5'-bisphosphate nucleotidase